MIELKGRTKTAIVEPEVGESLLRHALKAKVDWSSNCTRGTCARCRCFIEEGAAGLAGITDAEWDRMEPEEFEEGYRQWRIEFDRGRAGVFTAPVAEVIAGMEHGLNQ